MIKKLIVTFVAAFVIVTVAVAVYSARTGDRRRPPRPATQTSKTPNLNTSPPHFPER